MALSRTGLIFILFHLIYTISTQELLTPDAADNKQELSKRAPQGFIGMRGRRFIEALDQFYKRKPQFWKREFDLPYSMENKRAPMGFVGMRGKKALYAPEYYDVPRKQGSLMGEIDYSADNQVLQFPILNKLINDYLAKLENQEQDKNDIQKRAANMNQFYHVRGKKSAQLRGKFIGVRGKKDVSDFKNDELRYLLDPKKSRPKRKSQVGFFGMRGKKWTDDSSSEGDDQLN